MRHAAHPPSFILMDADFVPPIKSILKTLESAIKLARRVTRSADLAPPDQGRLVSESAQELKVELEKSSKAIKDAYAQSLEICGNSFTQPLREDTVIQSQLKDLRIGLIDLIDECNDFDDDLDLFDPAGFTKIQHQARKCGEACISIFHDLRDAHFKACLGSFRPEQEARSRLAFATSKQPPDTETRSQPPPSPGETRHPSQFAYTHAAAPLSSVPQKPKSTWSIEDPSQFGPEAPAPVPFADPRRRRPVPAPEPTPTSPPSAPGGQGPSWIPYEIVHSRINTNEEFLERRRQSRILFQNEIQKSTSPVNEREAGEASVDRTMVEHRTTSPTSIEERHSRTSSSGYDSLITSHRSQGQSSEGTRSSRGSSVLHDRPQKRRSQEPPPSQNFLKTTPFSPVSEHPVSDYTELQSPIPPAPQAPPYASEIESGLEVVRTGNIDYDTEKMLVEEPIYPRANTTASVKSIDHHMRHDTSFYKFGGFCDGAKTMMRGEPGFKVVKRPSGHYSATVSARCIKCAYEVGWSDVEKDRLLQRDGIYGNSGIRWRQRFISKCHVRAASIEEPLYACVFCIEEGKTVEENDATLFFSVGQLFNHLAKHSRPLPNVAGIITLYGFQPPETLDFDIHFTTSEPRPAEYNMTEIASKVATRPTARAISTHHPKPSVRSARDPDGNPSLHFAAGAKIVGITFPERFGGQWCFGYHDGSRGCLPADKIALEMPVKEDILMNPQSTLSAVARWDFKPKDAKDGGWLKFSKGDKLTCIGYTFQDQWCWSGQNSKGKWGIFPSSFAKDLKDTIIIQRPGTMKSQSFSRTGSGFGSIMGLGRKTSKSHERSNSMMSNVSGSGSISTQSAPDLEMSRSRGGTWRS